MIILSYILLGVLKVLLFVIGTLIQLECTFVYAIGYSFYMDNRPNSTSNPHLLHLLHWAGRFSALEPRGKPYLLSSLLLF